MRSPLMRTTLFLLLTCAAASVSAHGRRADTIVEQTGKSPVEANFASGGHIRIEPCSSTVKVIGSDDGKLRVTYAPDVVKNGKTVNAENVKVRIDVVSDHGDVRVSGCPHNNFQMTVEVPKSSDLRVRMFAGELTISGIAGDKDVELHAGELTMDVGDPADYGRVHASVNSGDLEASAFNVSKSGLFRSFAQTGPGKHALQVHVGAGDLTLR